MTQELISAIEMLQCNAAEMDELMVREAQDNVLLELEERQQDKKLEMFLQQYKVNNFQSQQRDWEEESTKAQMEQLYGKTETFSGYVKAQLIEMDLNDRDKGILNYLIDNLDERGYFPMDLAQAADALSMETHDLYAYLQLLWTMEPKGVGARDLRECLLLQLEGEEENLRRIVDEFLYELGNNQLNKIAKALSITPQQVQEYADRIKRCNPKPAAGFFSGEQTPYIFPEIFVTRDEEGVQVEILDALTHRIHLNPYYVTLLEQSREEETKEYLKKKYQKALFLLESMEKRRNTISRVVEEIVRAQEDFFLGCAHLQPLRLETIAKRCDLSESTVSRVSRNKYLQCSQGIFPLKYFFPQGFEQDGQLFSREWIKSKILELLEQEDPKHPLSDQKICDCLQQEGCAIKRRTVAKYREELGIASTSRRKRF